MLWADLIREVRKEGDAKILETSDKRLSDYLSLLHAFGIGIGDDKWSRWRNYIKRVLKYD